MIKLTILVFVYIKITTGYLEESTSYNSFPSIDNSGRPDWPVPVYYGAPQVHRRKPCPHRRNNAQAPWVPTFSATITKPLSNNVLEPQALKNENVENIVDGETKIPKHLPAEPFSSNEHNTIDTNPNEASNIDGTNRRPNDEGLSENDDKARNIDRTNRRSNIEKTPNSESSSEGYDCDIDLETEDYFESQYGRGQLTAVTSGPTTAKIIGFEQKVIEMLKKCINKKQKYIDDKLTQLKEIPIAGSRRSMGDSDIDHENDVMESVKDVDDTQTTIHTNEKTTNNLLTNTDNTHGNVPKVSYKVKETPSFTLRPGKLFNELQNPAKTTGIAEFPTRRMPADGSRVCYACSTATNPSCWEPNNKTTVKYCRKGQICITKSFGVKNSLTVLRDCSESCDATGVAGIEHKYKSCSVCHKDLCNSAPTNSYHLIIIFLITAIKCTF